jgi:hypothetical protein
MSAMQAKAARQISDRTLLDEKPAYNHHATHTLLRHPSL